MFESSNRSMNSRLDIFNLNSKFWNRCLRLRHESQGRNLQIMRGDRGDNLLEDRLKFGLMRLVCHQPQRDVAA